RLDRGELWMGYGKQGFIHRLHAHTKMPDQTFLLKILHPCQQITCFQYIGRHTMKLSQIQRLNTEPLNGSGKIRFDFGFGVTLWEKLTVAADSRVDQPGGRDGAEVLTDPLFTHTGTVNIGCLPELNPLFVTRTQNLVCTIIIYRSLIPAELPAADVGFGDVISTFAECSLVH